jgi:hypothetical protein
MLYSGGFGGTVALGGGQRIWGDCSIQKISGVDIVW